MLLAAPTAGTPATDVELLAAWSGWRKAMADTDADDHSEAACAAYRQHSDILADTVALTPAGVVIKLAALTYEGTDPDGMEESTHHARRLIASLDASAANLPDLADALRFAAAEALKDMEFKRDLSDRWWKAAKTLEEWQRIERIFDRTGVTARQEEIRLANEAAPREADGLTKGEREFLEAVRDMPEDDQDVVCDCMSLVVLAAKIERAMVALGKRSDYATGLMRRIGKSLIEAADDTPALTAA